MDSHDVDITFDANGYCNHCSDFLQETIFKTYQVASSDRALAELLERIKAKGKNKTYDCVLGISGGADSCYTAYQCKQLGLRALLVHVDNGWNTATSVSNIETVCKNLGLDYVNRVLPWNDFKEIQLSHLRASVPEMESPTDIALLEELHKVAAAYGIHYIVTGGNFITEGILPKNWHYNAKDKKYAKAIHKQYGHGKTKYFPSFDFWQEMYFKFWKRIKIVYLLNYLPFQKAEAVTLLESLGWKKYGEKHHESFYTRIVQSYILPKKFNIDYRKATLSTKICTGSIERDEALEKLKQSSYKAESIESDIVYVCKKLGITRSEFEDIMQQKPRIYKDFPNHQKLLEWLYGLYRKF